MLQTEQQKSGFPQALAVAQYEAGSRSPGHREKAMQPQSQCRMTAAVVGEAGAAAEAAVTPAAAQ